MSGGSKNSFISTLHSAERVAVPVRLLTGSEWCWVQIFSRIVCFSDCFRVSLFGVKSNPITGLDRPWGFQEVEAPIFQDNRHMKVVSLSAVRTGQLYPQGNIPGTHFWDNTRAMVRPEGLCRWKIPMTLSGIEPATFRLVAQCLNLNWSTAYPLFFSVLGRKIPGH